MRFFLIALVSAGLLYGSQALGSIDKIDGNVKLLKSGEVKKSRAEVGQEVFEGDMVITATGAMAAVSFTDESRVVLDERSKLTVKGMEEMKQEGGKVYYHIAKRGARGLKVATNFAVIGVKGTKFLVTDDNSSKEVALKEGLVGVQSIKEEFALYRQKVLDEYEAYKRQMDKEFEEFKAEGEKEFVGNFKEIDLNEGKKLSFDGNRADETTDPEAIAKEFSRFENF